jgi:hypothetical protein
MKYASLKQQIMFMLNYLDVRSKFNIITVFAGAHLQAATSNTQSVSV